MTCFKWKSKYNFGKKKTDLYNTLIKYDIVLYENLCSCHIILRILQVIYYFILFNDLWLLHSYGHCCLCICLMSLFVAIFVLFFQIIVISTETHSWKRCWVSGTTKGSSYPLLPMLRGHFIRLGRKTVRARAEKVVSMNSQELVARCKVYM